MNCIFDEYTGVVDRYVSITRTEDRGAILSVLEAVREEIWDRAGDIPVPIHPSIYHFLVMVDGNIAGNVCFIPINPITWNPHINVLPNFRGVGTKAMNMACEWMRANTECKKLVAYPPAYNTAMIRVFEKCGFSREGYSPNSFLFKGQIYGRILMGK